MTGRYESRAPVFNPTPLIRVVPVGPGRVCVVIDNALGDPSGLVEWAAGQNFSPPRGYPYPGVVLDAPEELARHVGECFARHARSRLGARRTVAQSIRFSLVTTPPEMLAPIQWQCHRDRLAADPKRVLYAASVLYLFRDPALGGTTFYLPKLPAEKIDRMIEDSDQLAAGEFSARYGLSAGYMRGSNAYFDKVARIGAAWNRMICYDGEQFHSADVGAAALDASPRSGRLTLNGFYTCSRAQT
ncbi:MAG: hypothetical protein KGL25_07775 [Gammaproteobacteria bacterium]|nr:hypothetical protein [Gammaproteobacteria bacterium]